ncbi:MAG TPA: plasmid maintenance system killer [Sphaerochaeta sp.]|nr:plasmid maintenance system killer [Sphaerochaeta sp.]
MLLPTSWLRSFADKNTERIFQSVFVKKFSKEVQIISRRELWSIDIAAKTSDLNVPPGNGLEQLEGNRKGQYSIRVNDQWRICFVWSETECIATEVEIVDYH